VITLVDGQIIDDQMNEAHMVWQGHPSEWLSNFLHIFWIYYYFQIYYE
jgi:hypothetical protein